jgi:hypothetical protein
MTAIEVSVQEFAGAACRARQRLAISRRRQVGKLAWIA